MPHRLPAIAAARWAAAVCLAAGAWLAGAPPAAAQQGSVVPVGTKRFVLSPVERPPRLQNREEMAREIAARYPSAQREAGVTGDVLVGLKILPGGSVDSGSVSVEHATDPAFAGPAVAIARRLRFNPPRARDRRAGVWHLFPMHFDTRSPPAGPEVPPDGIWESWRVDEQPGLMSGQYLEADMNRWYPPAQRDGEVPGDVLLRFRVMIDGMVDPVSLSVVQATNTAFVEPAMEIARRLRFTPAKVRGQPVAVWFTLPLHFRFTLCEGLLGDGTWDLLAVEVRPTLRNSREIARLIETQYAALRDSGVSARVVLRFRILENGRVDPTSVGVEEEATNATIETLAKATTSQMVFAPAKVSGCPVKVWVSLPFSVEFEPPTPAASDSTATSARPGLEGRGGRP